MKSDENNKPAGIMGKAKFTPLPVKNITPTPGVINTFIINSCTENPGNTSGKGGYKNTNKGTALKLSDDF